MWRLTSERHSVGKTSRGYLLVEHVADVLESLRDEAAILRTMVHKHGAGMRHLQNTHLTNQSFNAGARSTRLLAHKNHDAQCRKQREQPMQIREPILNIISLRRE